KLGDWVIGDWVIESAIDHPNHSITYHSITITQSPYHPITYENRLRFLRLSEKSRRFGSDDGTLAGGRPYPHIRSRRRRRAGGQYVRVHRQGEGRIGQH